MRRRVLAVATALTCSVIFLVGPAVEFSWSADDGNAKGKGAGTDLFGMTRIVQLNIEIPEEEYQAMQPEAPAPFGGPPPAPRPKRPGERESERNLFGVDRFLRFMAVQAMIANADGFFTLGYNYSLFLDPMTNRFVFIPGDQELSFANFLMMGSADQLMDMSVARPYGGENRLVDRLLAIKEVREAHQKILRELATTVFRRDRLLADAAASEQPE